MKISTKIASAIGALSLAMAIPSANAEGWAGGYVGVNLGFSYVNADAKVSAYGLSVSGSGSDTKGSGGFIGGYNWQNGNTVYGIEGDVNFVSDLDYLASIRGRYGILSNNWLYYGTAGVGFISSGGSVSGYGFHYDGYNTAGFVIGGGAETKITRNLTAGVEGLYYAFPEDKQNIGYGVNVSTSADIFSVRARLTWHFNDSSYDGLK